MGLHVHTLKRRPWRPSFELFRLDLPPVRRLIPPPQPMASNAFLNIILAVLVLVGAAFLSGAFNGLGDAGSGGLPY